MRPDHDLTPTHGPWKRLSPISRTPCDEHKELIATGIQSRIVKDAAGVLVAVVFAGCPGCSGLPSEVVE